MQNVKSGNKLLKITLAPCKDWKLCVSIVFVNVLAANLAYLDTGATLDLGSQKLHE
jgi:hypothetical protein